VSCGRRMEMARRPQRHRRSGQLPGSSPSVTWTVRSWVPRVMVTVTRCPGGRWPAPGTGLLHPPCRDARPTGSRRRGTARPGRGTGSGHSPCLPWPSRTWVSPEDRAVAGCRGAALSAGKYLRWLSAGEGAQRGQPLSGFMLLLAPLAALQRRVLYPGVRDALVLRSGFAAAGSALIDRTSWIIYVFGVLVLRAAARMFRPGTTTDPGENLTVRGLRRVLPITGGYPGGRFFARAGGKTMATPLVAWSRSSRPTWCSRWTLDPGRRQRDRDLFVMFTSNAFAVLGRRSVRLPLRQLGAPILLPQAGTRCAAGVHRREDRVRSVRGPHRRLRTGAPAPPPAPWPRESPRPPCRSRRSCARHCAASPAVR
jgi:hypothetical protein